MSLLEVIVQVKLWRWQVHTDWVNGEKNCPEVLLTGNYGLGYNFQCQHHMRVQKILPLKQLSGLLHKGTNLIPDGSTLMSQPPNTITLRVRFQHMNLGDTNIQFIAPSLPVLWPTLHQWPCHLYSLARSYPGTCPHQWLQPSSFSVSHVSLPNHHTLSLVLVFSPSLSQTPVILLLAETYNLWLKYVFTNNLPLHCLIALNLDLTAHHHRTFVHTPQLSSLYLPGRTSTMAELINNKMEMQSDNKCLFLYLLSCFRHCYTYPPPLELFKRYLVTVINFFPSLLVGAHTHGLCHLTSVKQLVSRPLRTSSCQI